MQVNDMSMLAIQQCQTVIDVLAAMMTVQQQGAEHSMRGETQLQRTHRVDLHS